MTRDFTFTLANANTWYNLWKDLISPTITDPTMSNSPYTPDRVSELEIQNQTAGSNVRRSTDISALTNGFNLTGASWDILRSSVNEIDLKKINFNSDVAGTQLYVSLNSR